MKFLRRLAHVVSILVLFASVGVSQTPPQEPPRRNEQRNLTDSRNQQAAPNPRGTDYTPLVVEIKPTPKTDGESAKEKREENERASDRIWSRSGTLATAVTGFIGLILLGVQLRIYNRQREIMAAQNTVMERQAALMELPYQQWVSIDTLTLAVERGHEDIAGPMSLASLINYGTEEKDVWSIGILLRNNTKFPLEIGRVEIGIEYDGILKYVGKTLAPDGGYEWQTIRIAIQEHTVRTLNEGKEIWPQIVGRITYINALKLETAQTFGRTGKMSNFQESKMLVVLSGAEMGFSLGIMDQRILERQASRKATQQPRPEHKTYDLPYDQP